MSINEELKVDKFEDLKKVTGGSQERARVVYGITCPECGCNDLEVIQKDIFGRMKLQCNNCQNTWWKE